MDLSIHYGDFRASTKTSNWLAFGSFGRPLPL
jgi:hypothetical protein